MQSQYQFSIPVVILKEGKCFIAYSPVLDLSTVGKTFEEAKKRFVEAVNLFFQEIIEAKTVDKALTELGWEKQNNNFAPPSSGRTSNRNFFR